MGEYPVSCEDGGHWVQNLPFLFLHKLISLLYRIQARFALFIWYLRARREKKLRLFALLWTLYWLTFSIDEVELIPVHIFFLFERLHFIRFIYWKKNLDFFFLMFALYEDIHLYWYICWCNLVRVFFFFLICIIIFFTFYLAEYYIIGSKLVKRGCLIFFNVDILKRIVATAATPVSTCAARLVYIILVSCWSFLFRIIFL